jgi:protein-tyrosine phosphatase
VAVKEGEHRQLIEARFPTQFGRVEYWEVHDLDFAGPVETISHLEREVLGLIERLKDQRERNDHFSTENGTIC